MKRSLDPKTTIIVLVLALVVIGGITWWRVSNSKAGGSYEKVNTFPEPTDKSLPPSPMPSVGKLGNR